MLEDRYIVNKPLYLTGMICLILAMGLVMFALYILPRLLWNLHYDVPLFITEYQFWLQDEWGWTERGSDWIVFFSFFIPGLIFGWISDMASIRLDSQMPTLPVQPVLAESNKRSRRTWLFAGKVTLIIVSVLVVFGLINLMLY